LPGLTPFWVAEAVSTAMATLTPPSPDTLAVALVAA
jgi:hypothetical protein